MGQCDRQLPGTPLLRNREPDTLALGELFTGSDLRVLESVGPTV